MKTLRLYSRGGCHLCDDMEAALSPYIRQGKIEVQRVYIDNDETLVARYGERIPLLMWRQQIICEYFFDAVALTRLLTEEPDCNP